MPHSGRLAHSPLTYPRAITAPATPFEDSGRATQRTCFTTPAPCFPPMPDVRTRFATSPTGYMHIGGMRTALFNWLWARHTGGKFILRIDDTDLERNLDDALNPILAAFRWLGLDWDEGPEVGGPYGPYFQSQRNQLYVDAAMKLVDAGHAYPCYTSKEELDAARKEAEKAKKDYIHRGQHRNTPPAEFRR